MSQTESEFAKDYAKRVFDALHAFGIAVPKFSMLREQRVEMFNEVRWWKAAGWDVLRNGNGEWMGWANGGVAWPPMYGRASVNDMPAIAREVVLRHGGFYTPATTEAAKAFELRLVAFRR